MHAELQWTRTYLERLDEAMRKASWNLGRVREKHSETSCVWNDTCATDITRRYLNPMQDEAQHSLSSLQSGTRGFDASVGSMSQAALHLDDCMREIVATQSAAELARSCLRTAANLCLSAVSQADYSENCCEQARVLISQAAEAGAE